jgi:flagellar motor protein MotB
MTRRAERDNNEDSLNIFQAFTDLMSNAFMIVSFFLLISLLQAMMLKRELEVANEKLKSAAPIIIDEKSGQFKFPSGRAEVTTDLQTHIKTKIIPEIEKATKQGNIDFIQVIGHTDGQATKSSSNLDIGLTPAATGSQTISSLKAGSNADLGLMRAVAVVQLLQQNKGFEQVKFRAYSAAQLYLPSGNLATSNQSADDSRRRIEIRFIPKGQKQ